MEAPEAENPEARPPVPPWGFPEWFVISQTAFPALLLVPGSQSVRLPLRAASFAVSLLGLVWRRPGGWGRPVGHPSQPFLAAVLIYLVFMLFHPTTNSLTAGCVQILLYLAVLAPAFWAPRLVRGPEHLARLLFLFLVCNGINAAMGVLQVYAPGVWMPKELSTVITTSEYGLDAVSYLGPDGTRIVRPPGLFDNPGAVCGPGMTAGVLGLIFCLAPASLGKKGLGLGLALAGMAVIYLSQVRTSLLLVGGMAVVFPVVLVVLQGEWRKAAWFVGLMGLLLTAAFSLAVALGGPSIRERFTTLVDKNPVELFYASRGQQLEAGLKSLLVEYPLGAGLGRWGIIQTYFGDAWNKDAPPIWAEVQPNAWILDGGLVVLCFYGLALLGSTLHNLRLAGHHPDKQVRFWAAAVFTANAGILALMFSFTPFTSPLGLQYWFLAGALQGAARNSLLASSCPPLAPASGERGTINSPLAPASGARGETVTATPVLLSLSMCYPQHIGRCARAFATPWFLND